MQQNDSLVNVYFSPPRAGKVCAQAWPGNSVPMPCPPACCIRWNKHRSADSKVQSLGSEKRHAHARPALWRRFTDNCAAADTAGSYREQRLFLAAGTENSIKLWGGGLTRGKVRLSWLAATQPSLHVVCGGARPVNDVVFACSAGTFRTPSSARRWRRRADTEEHHEEGWRLASTGGKFISSRALGRAEGRAGRRGLVPTNTEHGCTDIRI